MLSKRLQMIADLIEPKTNVIDIGCDHALLDIYLTINKQNNCIATDISEKVIKNASENIKKYNLLNKIELVIGDGIGNIKIKKNTNIVISGMGSNTILKILKNINYNNINSLIIQSNNELEYLRKEICKLNYYITDEKSVYDKGKYYVIIKFEKGIHKYTNNEYKFGPILISDSNAIDYYLNIINKNNEIINKLNIKHIKKILSLKKDNIFLKKKLKKI